MRARQSPIESLVLLPRLADPADRRARWRQAVTALGRELRVDGPPLLDGVPAEDLVRTAQTALETNLVDDLDWIAPGSAAVALYELSSALPPGKERREIGRRVFARLYEGDAATFAAVATRMALGAGRTLEAATLRARIGLVFNLPTGSSVNADPLALVLVSRRDLFERWIGKAATGPLPARRLSARLYERAAREAVRRAHQGDPHPAELMNGPDVRPVFDRLLADREPLVWRHAATARGVLSAVQHNLREDIELGLDPDLSPTEWRRAAVSLVACISTDVSAALARCEKLLDGEILKRDPGLAATLVWGLPVVIETEPEAAVELLDRLSLYSRLDIAEAISALLCDVANPEFAADAAERLRSGVLESAASADPTMHAVFEDTLRGLDRNRSHGGVHAAVMRALEAYESLGARVAHELAVEALARANTTMDALETLGGHAGATLSDVLGPLGDLDSSAIEQSRLHDLLLLGRSPGDTNSTVPEMERLYDRLGKWILDREETYVEGEFSRGEMVARRRTLRALLHLADLDASARSDTETEAAKKRLRRMIQVLLRTLSAGPDASAHRIICATLARALDAAAREGVADPSDLLLVVLDRIWDAHGVLAMMEASTNPDVRDALKAYSEFLATGVREFTGSLIDVSVDGVDGQRDEISDARSFVALSRGIGTNGSYRGEALRQVTLKLGRALEAVANARGLTELVEPPAGEGYPLSDVEHYMASLRQLMVGARRRVLDDAGGDIHVVAEVPPLAALIERAVTGVPPNHAQLSMSIGEVSADMPPPIAGPTNRVLTRVTLLPVMPPSDVSIIPLQTRRAELPDWLLPRRTIGAFYVVRALGAGGVSSVFVVRRLEERRTATAELFALKVPQYDPSTARSLSEQQFLQLFREEAGALLSLPQHGNLARFVTFDLAARPKPILVMELISGAALDRLIRNRSLTMEHALRYLDGILAGLEAMHAVGVGHLDVKPSNVILRDGETPVLVDFGLSGRHLRPGCGTLEYCAPEILGVVPKGVTPSPAAADLYAFACTAFELLTGNLLFDADDEAELMQQHVEHDGWPEKLTALAAPTENTNLCVVLSACLRGNPANRPSASEVRKALASASQWLSRAPWPLKTGQAATGLSA